MKNKNINLVVADMGYGHQRPAHSLRYLAGNSIYNLNDYIGIEEWEKRYWEKSLKTYEKISRLKKVPVLGSVIFKVMDEFQKIRPFYPLRNLSRPTIQQYYFQLSIKKGLGLNLINSINDAHKPFVTTFFVAAYLAEYHNYLGDIYCIICDTDASRAWAPLKTRSSRVKLFLPNEKTRERFIMYGINPENLFVTGFPLPQECIGTNDEIAKKNLCRRISNLDINNLYQNEYKSLIKSVVGSTCSKNNTVLTISFAVGGAGAQKEIAITILNSLSYKIKKGLIKFNLIAGSRRDVFNYFVAELSKLGLENSSNVSIIFAEEKNDYFDKFNNTINKTDILITKPSELSFYCALGLPILILDPVGSQEDFNRKWLISVGAGVDALEEQYTNQWLEDLLESGRLARAAVDGYINASREGVVNIEKILDIKE